MRNNTRYYGLYGGATGWLIGSSVSHIPRSVVVVRDQKVQEALASDIAFFTGKNPILLSGWESMPFEEVSPETTVASARVKSLLEISSTNEFISVITVDALLQKVLPLELLRSLSFDLKVGDSIDVSLVTKRLEYCGYFQNPLVESVGEFAVRGEAIDIFTPSTFGSVRIFLADGHIEDIKKFHPDTQRTEEPIPEIRIIPVREVFVMSAKAPFQKYLPDAISRLKTRGKELETPPREIARFMAAFRSGALLPGIELMQYVSLPNTEELFDLISKDATWFIYDQLGIEQMLDELWAQVESRYDRLSTEHQLIPEKEIHFLPPERIMKRLHDLSPIKIDSLELFEGQEQEEAINIRSASNAELKIKIASHRTSGEADEALRSAIMKFRRQDMRVAFVVGAAVRAERLHSLLQSINIDAPIGYLSGLDWMHHPAKTPVMVLQGNLSHGFQLPMEKVVFIAENEIFSERSVRHSKKSKWSLKRILNSLAQLSEGDYVVHSDYGVGIYRGLKHFEVEGSIGDFLQIEYADSRLYLPVQNIGRVQKFSAAEGQTPHLDKLASTRWTKTKAKVRESVAQLAGDLIRLYAARSVSKGWRFEPMGAEDDRFADNFPYDETPDQLKAIEDTLCDMAKDSVMDRLVCGDVGFGKTEVAIRAAYKCVQHARQVALLVPTTILTEQHKKSFLNRFSGYDVRIDSLSRFTVKQEVKNILERLKEGTTDIIIGTHRLLSNDIQFKDLGLLIIDEEHRFGVKQKEKLKALKKSVDVLTLTATPIPRTLHMSLIGVRDISVISTPPTDRRTIRTYIANHDDALIRDAIIREIQRGGQVFFVHNRVQSIDVITAGLKNLVPEASFRFAHGQMTESMLEDIMTDFIDKKFDVLVSTTIIESGIDIPNANTMIVERADTFGLAQLYQLRGRVGRSTRQAYAYFLVPKARNLNADARKRLKALQALDDLGLGFNLAMKDMEIRGAGNLLGKEQSGSVLAVGFDLYSKILKEAVLHLKGEEIDLSETIDPEIKLPSTGFIPEWYIPDVSERLILYQRLSGIENEAQKDALSEEIRDRFGPPPQELSLFIEVMRMRALLRKFGILKAEIVNDAFVVTPSKKAPLNAEKLFSLCKKHPDKFKLGKALSLAIKLDKSSQSDVSALYAITHQVLSEIGN